MMNAYDKIGQLKVATSSVAAENRGYQYDPGWNLNYRTETARCQIYTIIHLPITGAEWPVGGVSTNILLLRTQI